MKRVERKGISNGKGEYGGCVAGPGEEVEETRQNDSFVIG